MDYILTGDKRYVDMVLAMTSHLVNRGDIKFIPVNTAKVGVLVADDKYVSPKPEDSKQPPVADEKKPVKRSKNNPE